MKLRKFISIVFGVWFYIPNIYRLFKGVVVTNLTKLASLSFAQDTGGIV
jgi:hypothetical protein